MDMFTENQSPNRKVNQCYNKNDHIPTTDTPEWDQLFH